MLLLVAAVMLHLGPVMHVTFQAWLRAWHGMLPECLPNAAGELVIVDVNYFPSFKGIPEAPAALQAALRERWAASLAVPGGV
jgi:hypothetical protein